ncbi:MAG TPA: DUF3592 domain-containing protein [Tepidisphaeraceae bacterium]|jgi:hypothetical protein
MIGIGVFLVLMVVGLVLLWTESLRPVLRARAVATGWDKVPCTILDSTVTEHPETGSGEDRTTYSVEVRYRYTVSGRTYESSRLNVFPPFAGSRPEKQAIANRYPPGSTAVCYVNPADPTDAVLESGLNRSPWLLAFPLVFVLVGLIGLIVTLRGHRRFTP